MKEQPTLGKKMESLAIGAGLVTLGPEAVKSVFGNITEAAGADVPFMPDSSSFLGHAVEAGVDTAQGFVGPLALFMLIKAGFEKMLSGGKN